MDFMSGFPLTQKKYDSVWVIVDRLTKSTRFLPIRLDYSIDRYVNEIVQLHGIPLLIQIDRQFERVIQVLEDMLWGCMLDFPGS